MAVLTVVLLMLVIFECISTNRCGALQKLPYDNEAGYYHNEKEKENYFNSLVSPKPLTLQPYSKYFDGGPVHPEIFRDGDESYSFDDEKNDLGEIVKRTKHGRKTAETNLHNSRINYSDGIDYVDRKKDNLNDFDRITRNAKRCIEKSVLQSAKLSNNLTDPNDGKKLIYVEQDSQSYGNENKSMPNSDKNKKYFKCHKTDKGDGDNEEEYLSDNSGDTKGNINSKTGDSCNKDITKTVTSSFDHYSAKVLRPTDMVDFPRVNEHNELDEGKNKSENPDKCKKKDLIIQPIQINRIENNCSGGYSNDEIPRLNEVLSYGKGTNYKISKVNKDMRNLYGKKTLFIPSDSKYLGHDEQDLEMLSTRFKQPEKIFKTWPQRDSEDSAHLLNNEHRMELSSNFIRDVGYPRDLSQQDYVILNNVSVNSEADAHKHKRRNCKSFQSDISFDNFRKCGQFSHDHARSSSIRRKHIYSPFNADHKITFNSDLSREKYYPEIRNSISKNLFVLNNMNNYHPNSHSAFSSSKVNNNVHYRQRKSIPTFVNGNENSADDNLLFNEIDPVENLYRNYSIFSNESCNVTKAKRNYIMDHDNLLDVSTDKENDYRNENRLPCKYSSDSSKKIVEVDSIQNISESGVRSHKPVNFHKDFYPFLSLKNNHIADPKKRSLLSKPNVSLRPFHHYNLADDTDDYTDDIANVSKTNLQSSNTIYDYDFGEKYENINKNNFHDGNGKQSEVNDGAFMKKDHLELINSLEKFGDGDVQHKSTRKKTDKSSILSEIEGDVLNSDNNILGSSVKKNKHKKIQEAGADSDQDKVTVLLKPDKRLPPKKCTESGVFNFGNRLSAKIIGKQCHPPAGPPKFRWCSEDSDPVKDQEYEDALKGKVALRIVEVILAKVHKSSKMTSDFGFCKNQKRPVAVDEENECIAQNSILKSEDLKEIMFALEKMSYKGCNQLPPKLKEFLEWLVRVKHVRSVPSKRTGFGKHSHSNCSLGDSAFLFHRYGVSSSNIQSHASMGRQFEPYETVADYDYNNMGSGMRSDHKGLNSDRNPIKEDSRLIADYLKPVFTKKYKRQARERESKFFENSINSDSVKERLHFLRYSNPTDIMTSGLKNERKSGSTFDYYMSDSVQPLSDLSKYCTNGTKSGNENINDHIMFVSKHSEDKISPLDKFISDSGSFREANQYKNSYSSPTGIRQQRSNRKLKLQELVLEKHLGLFPEVRRNDRNKQSRYNTLDIDREDNAKNRKGMLNEEQQQEFYTPIVFRVSDEYEI